MSETDEKLAELWKRLTRIEATMDELDKALGLYRNDKAYEERERKEVKR